ncbi:hypothetical protein CPB86DRAFT_819640 [Serendipita vermifera]|nr:hypothetical protein CPB86DRAFT_819640 [Serendipita vermifera]
MSSDFVHVTLPPPSPTTSNVIQDGALEEDTDLATLVEDFMRATQLQISLKQHIDSLLEKKAREAAEQEEKARLAWINQDACPSNAGKSTEAINSPFQAPSTKPTLLTMAGKAPIRSAGIPLDDTPPMTPRPFGNNSARKFDFNSHTSPLQPHSTIPPVDSGEGSLDEAAPAPWDLDIPAVPHEVPMAIEEFVVPTTKMNKKKKKGSAVPTPDPVIYANEPALEAPIAE